MEGKQELHPALEAEINRLSVEILSGKHEGMANREIIRKSLAEGVPKETPKEPIGPLSGTVLSDYAAEESPEIRLYVEHIIDKLWHDGDLIAATNEAKKRGALILDIFHDSLTGKFHDIMKQRGIFPQ